MKVAPFIKNLPFTWNLLVLILPIVMTLKLITSPIADDPEVGKAQDFLCWEQSWHDFTIIFNFSKSVQNNSIERPYTTSGQLSAYEAWLHYPKQEVMPVSYSPVCLFLLGGLSFLSVQSAFLIWNLLVAFTWFKVTQLFQKQLSSLQGTLLSFIICVSSIGYMSFYFGQTALLYCGLLILLSSWNFTSSSHRYLFTSFAMCLLLFKPPGAILAGAILLFQRRRVEFSISLILPSLITVLFCIQHHGVQTIIDYFTWIRACNIIEISPHFSGSILPIFQSNLISYLMNVSTLSKINILFVNQILIVLFILLGVFLLLTKKLETSAGPYWLGWVYLLFSPYLGITEDLIAGWILYNWIQRHPKIRGFGFIWLIILLNTSQAYSIIAPAYFYLHPITWPFKLVGFIGWVSTEIIDDKSKFHIGD